MSNGLLCAICREVAIPGETEPRPAETVINGQAVCGEHACYVQGGSFAVALQLARAHQIGRQQHGGD